MSVFGHSPFVQRSFMKDSSGRFLGKNRLIRAYARLPDSPKRPTGVADDTRSKNAPRKQQDWICGVKAPVEPYHSRQEQVERPKAYSGFFHALEFFRAAARFVEIER